MPRLRAVTGATVIVPVIVGLAGLVVLTACTAGGAVDSATVRDKTAAPPLRAGSQAPRSTAGATPGGPGTAAASPPPASSPTDTRSAAALLHQARDVFTGASSVHIRGTAVQGADAYVLDVRLAGPAGGTAKIEASGRTVDVVRIGDVAYVGGDLPFWRSITGDETKARQMAGSHVRTPVADTNFASFIRFTQPQTYAAVLPDPAQPATPTGTATIRGTRAVGARDAAGSTLYVAASGPTYPLRLDGVTGGQVVFLDFSDYGARVPLQAPITARVVGPGHGS